jgi:hypothetical protein
MKKIFFIIVAIGLVLAVAGFWYWQKNSYSKEVLKLEILGPRQVGAFEEVEYTVKLKNNGNVRLEDPVLIFEFPRASLREGPRRKQIEAEEIGDIYPGQERTFVFKTRLFGKEDETLKAEAWLSYRPKNIKARYESHSSLTTIIDSLPISLDFDLSSKQEAGKEFSFYLNYFSNLDYPVSDLGVRIEYPSGFEFLGGKPSGIENNEWEIPVLNKAEGGRIEVQGKLTGEINSNKVFRVGFGVWNDNEFILLKEITRGVEITEPHLFVSQRINGQKDYTANPGELLHYEIFFRNIGESPFQNMFLVARLGGEFFDLDSVKINSGQFGEEASSIIWDEEDIKELRFLDQGEEGRAEFWVRVKDEKAEAANPTLETTVLVGKVAQDFKTRINTKLRLVQQGYYSEGAFDNSGPVPPEAGEETTYTVKWTAENYYNDVRNAKVKAVLPRNVELTGEIYPEEAEENITFDSASREVVWSVGNSSPFYRGEKRSVSFQVSLRPSSSQAGEAADIIGRARISGEDQWTDKGVEDSDSKIDTTLPDDPSVSSDAGIVKE